jgi:hypothetical protein
MIFQGVCKLCSESIRVNGDSAYRNLARKHYMDKHPQAFSKICKDKAQADKELIELKSKYPNLYISFGTFSLSTKSIFIEVKE